MSRFLCRIGKTKGERHFAGKPRGNDTGRLGLNLEGKTTAQKTAVSRNRGFDVAVGTRLPQIPGTTRSPTAIRRIAVTRTGQEGRPTDCNCNSRSKIFAIPFRRRTGVCVAVKGLNSAICMIRLRRASGAEYNGRDRCRRPDNASSDSNSVRQVWHSFR
jgi:hypothetical protein